MEEPPTDIVGPETENDVPNQLMDFMNFYFMINPQNVCDEWTGVFIAILVHTALENLDRRTAIRKTWGRENYFVKVLFFMGKSKNYTVNVKIKDESNAHNDIVQGNFIDIYRNLTYKHVMLLKWATSFCKNAKYIVKADDDIMINTNYLYNKLESNYWGDKGLIACRVWNNSFVYRTWHKYNSKYGVTKEEYPESIYPPFCQGAFIIYSTDIVHRLLKESRKLPYYWLEDVHVTGTLAKRIGVNHTNIHQWILNRYRAAALRMLYKENRDSPKYSYIKPFVYGPINIEAEDMYTFWEMMNNYEKKLMKTINRKLNAMKINRTAIHAHFSQLKNAVKGR